MVSIGDREITYTMYAHGADGKVLNRGNLWANAHTIEDAHRWAAQLFARDNDFDPQVVEVSIEGAEYEFVGGYWARTGQGCSYEVLKTDRPIQYSKADQQLYCYDTTVMDYFETVHPRRADGTCQCGNPTRNVRK